MITLLNRRSATADAASPRWLTSPVAIWPVGGLFIATLGVALVLPLGAAGQTNETTDSDKISGPPPTTSGETPSRNFGEAIRLIVARTESLRQEHEHAPLEVDRRLSEASEGFAAYMAETGEYGHQADGRRPAQRATAAGYDYCLISENIAHLFSSEPLGDEELARRFVDGWWDSPEHRKNMLDPEVTQIGVAIAQSDQSGYIFAVQMFGRPRSAAIEFEIANQTQETLRYRLGSQTLELPPGYTRTHRRCRSGNLTLLDDQAAEEPLRTLEPRSGDRLAVVRSADGPLEIAPRPSRSR